MDEIVDVVDDNDNVIGKELKSKCHANRILHRNVAIFVFKDNSYKEILIQKRSMNKTSKPGKSCVPAGHLSSGEDYFIAAKRELQEEMFYNQELPNLNFEELFKIKKLADDDYEFNVVYRIVHSGPFSIDTNEAESYFFADFKDILKNIEFDSGNYTETTVLLLKEYHKRFNLF